MVPEEKTKNNLESRINNPTSEKVSLYKGALKNVAKVVAYIPIGCFPTEIQKRAIQKIGIKKRLGPIYVSVTLGSLYGAIQYFGPDLIERMPALQNSEIIMGYLNRLGNWTGILSFINESFRFGYVIAKKEPIGTLPVEIPYRIIKKIFKLRGAKLDERKIKEMCNNKNGFQKFMLNFFYNRFHKK